MTALSQVLELIGLFLSIGEGLFNRLGQFLADIWKAFPRPLAMADAVFEFISSISGIILTRAGSFYWTLAAARMKSSSKEFGRPQQTVQTPAMGIEMSQDYIETAIKFLTLTSENNLADTMLNWVGRSMWNLLQHFFTIQKLIGITSQAAAIAFIKGVFGKKRTTLLVYAVLGIAVAFCTLAVAVTGKLLFIGQMVEEKRWEKHVLFNRHPRQKMRVRISRRVGGVGP